MAPPPLRPHPGGPAPRCGRPQQAVRKFGRAPLDRLLERGGTLKPAEAY